MIKEIIFLSTIYIISSFYNEIIQPIIIKTIPIEYYNNIVISLLILIQIDNFTLFYDLSKRQDNDNTNSKIEDKYMKIILNQIEYINKKEREFNRKIVRFKDNHKKINRSCNDIFNLC